MTIKFFQINSIRYKNKTCSHIILYHSMNKIDICIGIFVCLEPTGCNPFFLLHKIKKRLREKTFVSQVS